MENTLVPVGTLNTKGAPAPRGETLLLNNYHMQSPHHLGSYIPTSQVQLRFPYTFSSQRDDLLFVMLSSFFRPLFDFTMARTKRTRSPATSTRVTRSAAAKQVCRFHLSYVETKHTF
jgi:hypothetical protein